MERRIKEQFIRISDNLKTRDSLIKMRSSLMTNGKKSKGKIREIDIRLKSLDSNIKGMVNKIKERISIPILEIVYIKENTKYMARLSGMGQEDALFILNNIMGVYSNEILEIREIPTFLKKGLDYSNNENNI